MADRLKSISLRQFRERAAEITEPIEIAIRDLDGNFRVLGFYTPYVTYPPGAVELPPNTGKLPTAKVTVDGKEVKPEIRTLDLPQPRIITTPEEAAAAAYNPVRAVPKPSARKKR